MDKDLTSRIMNATPLGLLLVTYDLFLDSLSSAKENFANNISPENDLNYAQKVLMELINGLNLEIPLATEVLTVYMYVNKLIIQTIIKTKRTGQDILIDIEDNLLEIEDIMTNLLKALETIEDTGSPIEPDATQIFAGLTYNKDGSLNEFVNNSGGKTFEV